MIVRASGVLMVLICLATMFLKQHSVIDVVGALLMASVIYPIAYAPEAEKKKKHWQTGTGHLREDEVRPGRQWGEDRMCLGTFSR